MIALKKGTNAAKSKSAPWSIALGATVSLSITLSAAAIVAALIQSNKLSPEVIGYAVMIILIVSSLAGSMVAGKRSVTKKMIICVLTAACYFVALLCITAMFFGGTYKGISVTALVVASGSIAAGLIPIQQGSGVKTRKTKWRYG